MMDEIVNAYGERFLMAAGGVVLALVLLVLVLWLVKRRSSSPFVRGGRSRQPRLQVLDAAAVDARRRLVLVRRDNIEHLILIGGPTDIVVESGIGEPKAYLTGELAAQAALAQATRAQSSLVAQGSVAAALDPVGVEAPIPVPTSVMQVSPVPVGGKGAAAPGPTALPAVEAPPAVVAAARLKPVAAPLSRPAMTDEDAALLFGRAPTGASAEPDPPVFQPPQATPPPAGGPRASAMAMPPGAASSPEDAVSSASTPSAPSAISPAPAPSPQSAPISGRPHPTSSPASGPVVPAAPATSQRLASVEVEPAAGTPPPAVADAFVPSPSGRSAGASPPAPVPSPSPATAPSPPPASYPKAAAESAIGPAEAPAVRPLVDPAAGPGPAPVPVIDMGVGKDTGVAQAIQPVSAAGRPASVATAPTTPGRHPIFAEAAASSSGAAKPTESEPRPHPASPAPAAARQPSDQGWPEPGPSSPAGPVPPVEPPVSSSLGSRRSEAVTEPRLSEPVGTRQASLALDAARDRVLSSKVEPFAPERFAETTAPQSPPTPPATQSPGASPDRREPDLDGLRSEFEKILDAEIFATPAATPTPRPRPTVEPPVARGLPLLTQTGRSGLSDAEADPSAPRGGNQTDANLQSEIARIFGDMTAPSKK